MFSVSHSEFSLFNVRRTPSELGLYLSSPWQQCGFTVRVIETIKKHINHVIQHKVPFSLHFYQKNDILALFSSKNTKKLKKTDPELEKTRSPFLCPLLETPWNRLTRSSLRFPDLSETSWKTRKLTLNSWVFTLKNVHFWPFSSFLPLFHHFLTFLNFVQF